MAISKLDQLAKNLKDMEQRAKQYAALYAQVLKQFKKLQVKFNDQTRELARNKQEIYKLQRDLKEAHRRAIWSSDNEV